MKDPHVHDVLFKKGLGEKQQRLVLEGMEILVEAGINPVTDSGALVWAPNEAGQHTLGNLQKVVDELRALKKSNGTKADFMKLLGALGKEAADR
jgi:hypothetical protein